MRIEKITISKSDEGSGWDMKINYENSKAVFGCNRPTLKEIVEELKWRI